MVKVVVTGAASGIGAEIAIQLSGQSDIELCLIDIKTCESTVSRCEKEAKILSLLCDVNDSEQLLRAAEQFLSQCGPPDLLFVNAGIGSSPFHTESLAEARLMMETNFFGAVRTIEVFLPSMMKQGTGTIVVSNSIGSLVGTHFSGAYSASKAALKIWCESLALRLNGSGVRVSTAIIGFVDTPMTDGMAHAQILKVSSRSVARAMIQSSKSKRVVVSIPWSRNLAWWILLTVPAKLRALLLRIAWKRLQ